MSSSTKAYDRLDLLLPALTEKEEPEATFALDQEPCAFFISNPDAPERCVRCNHSRQAHQVLHQTGSSAQVSSDGNTSRLFHAQSIAPVLPAAYYVLCASQNGLYLDHSSAPSLPPKVYGDYDQRARRTLKSFLSRPRSMGVMSSGRPGTGKTVLAKVICQHAIAASLPVIIIRQPFAGSIMNSFLEDLPTRCVFFVDEIEKIYNDKGARNWLLTVLDGTVLSRHLWVATCNDPNIGEAFRNRPGRIRYHWRFTGMDPELVKGIIHDNLQDTAAREAVHRVALRINDLTPDILMSIIEEVVIHQDLPKDFIGFFNVNDELPSLFNVTGHITRKTLDTEKLEILAQKDKGLAHRIIHNTKTYGIKDTLDDFPEAADIVTELSLEIQGHYVHNPLRINRDGEISISIDQGLRPKHAKVDERSFGLEWEAHECQVEHEGADIIIRRKGTKDWMRFSPPDYVQSRSRVLF